jgi:hypothetical protein
MNRACIDQLSSDGNTASHNCSIIDAWPRQAENTSERETVVSQPMETDVQKRKEANRRFHSANHPPCQVEESSNENRITEARESDSLKYELKHLSPPPSLVEPCTCGDIVTLKAIIEVMERDLLHILDKSLMYIHRLIHTDETPPPSWLDVPPSETGECTAEEISEPKPPPLGLVESEN